MVCHLPKLTYPYIPTFTLNSNSSPERLDPGAETDGSSGPAITSGRMDVDVTIAKNRPS